MGDLRNKLRKQMEWDRIMARAKARETPPEPPIHCFCGHTAYETTIYAVPDGWRQVMYCCSECMPAGLLMAQMRIDHDPKA